jgi:hypothetical protein
VLRRLFLERFYLPRRAMNLDLVHQAIAARELPRDTDPDLLIDALTEVREDSHARQSAHETEKPWCVRAGRIG